MKAACGLRNSSMRAVRQWSLIEDEMAALREDLSDARERRAGLQLQVDIGQKGAKRCIAHHQFLSVIEQRKALAHRFDRRGQVLFRRFGVIARVLEPCISIGEIFERALQVTGAGRDLAFEQDRRLE